jgi:hypothetical protein
MSSGPRKIRVASERQSAETPGAVHNRRLRVIPHCGLSMSAPNDRDVIAVNNRA